jgi:hypothetical protein
MTRTQRHCQGWANGIESDCATIIPVPMDIWCIVPKYVLADFEVNTSARNSGTLTRERPAPIPTATLRLSAVLPRFQTDRGKDVPTESHQPHDVGETDGSSAEDEQGLCDSKGAYPSIPLSHRVRPERANEPTKRVDRDDDPELRGLGVSLSTIWSLSRWPDTIHTLRSRQSERP